MGMLNTDGSLPYLAYAEIEVDAEEQKLHQFRRIRHNFSEMKFLDEFPNCTQLLEEKFDVSRVWYLYKNLEWHWNLKKDHISDLLVMLACCSPLYGTRANNGTRIIPLLWIDFWNLTVDSLKKRAQVCMLALQHHSVDAVILNVLVWSAIFRSPDEATDFAAKFLPRSALMKELLEIHLLSDVVQIVTSYSNWDSMENMLSDLFYRNVAPLPFPQICLFPLEYCQKNPAWIDFIPEHGVWKQKPIDKCLFLSSTPEVDLIVNQMMLIISPKFYGSCQEYFSTPLIATRLRELKQVISEIEIQWGSLR